MGDRPVRRGRAGAVATAVALAVLLGGSIGSAAASGYPPLPIADDRGFLGNLSAPTLAPGSSGTLTFSVGDPLAAPLVGAVLTLEVYAFNGFPGNATDFVPVAGAPVLVTPTTSGPTANVSLGGIAPHSVARGSVQVATSATTPNGAFAVRTALQFSANGTAYRLASRGWFSAAVWANATELPNGSVTVNLTRLGVSGVLPETAVVVASSTFEWVLAALLAGAVVLVAAGAFVYFRRGPGATSGAR